MGLFDGKGDDTEVGNTQPWNLPGGVAKSEGRADITTQNASSVMRSGPSKTTSKALNHEDVAFDIMEFDENDMKSMNSYKPQMSSQFGSGGLGKRAKNLDDEDLNKRSKTNIKPKAVPGRKIGLTDDKLSLKLGSVDEGDSEDEDESEEDEDLDMKPE